MNGSPSQPSALTGVTVYTTSCVVAPLFTKVSSAKEAAVVLFAGSPEAATTSGPYTIESTI